MLNTIQNTIDKYVMHGFDESALAYKSFAEKFGMFPCELQVFESYVDKTDQILDLGCGTGRTSFALVDQGYTILQACDISPRMIQIARQRCEETQYDIAFNIGDATNLYYKNDSFDVVFFSYNGIMTIPGFDNRLKAFQEIHRVLKPGGRFIFSCYRRDIENEYSQFWIEEKSRWSDGKQDPELHEFGDIIKSTKLERKPVFVHFPDQNELNSYAARSGYSKLESIPTIDVNATLSKIINQLEYYVAGK